MSGDEGERGPEGSSSDGLAEKGPTLLPARESLRATSSPLSTLRRGNINLTGQIPG